MHIDTTSMWLEKEIDYTKKSEDHAKDYSLDMLVFNSKKTYFRMHPLEGHLENIQLIEGKHKANYIIKDEEYFVVDGKWYGGYGTTVIPVCFLQADVIWDNHRERKVQMNGKINGIIRPVLDDNYEIKDIPPEFHFYLSMPQQIIFGHSVNDSDEDSRKILHVNMTNVDPNILDRSDKNVLDRFKHIYMRKSSHTVPSGFNIKTYHNDIRRENFSKGVFVTILEQ
jgi:hypothetical protein